MSAATVYLFAALIIIVFIVAAIFLDDHHRRTTNMTPEDRCDCFFCGDDADFDDRFY